MFADIADARLAIHFFYQIEIVIFLRQIVSKLFSVLGIYVSVLKNLICFSRISNLKQDFSVNNYWVDDKNKTYAEILKLFYKNVIYWQLVESEGRDTDENIFKSLFSSQESFIFFTKKKASSKHSVRAFCLISC